MNFFLNLQMNTERSKSIEFKYLYILIYQNLCDIIFITKNYLIIIKFLLYF